MSQLDLLQRWHRVQSACQGALSLTIVDIKVIATTEFNDLYG